MIGEILGESIKSACALKIRSDFAVITESEPPLYPTIYKEQVSQDLSKPCFFITTLDISQRKLFSNNFERIYQMVIRYHSKDDDLRRYETLDGIGNRLLETLNTIQVPIYDGEVDDQGEPKESLKPVRGTRMSFQITDKVLQFFITYTIKLKMGLEGLGNFMESLTETVEIKNKED